MLTPYLYRFKFVFSRKIPTFAYPRQIELIAETIDGGGGLMPAGEQSVSQKTQEKLPPNSISTAVTIPKPTMAATTPNRRPLSRIDRRLSGDSKENHLRAADTWLSFGSLGALLVGSKGGGGGRSAKGSKGGGGGRSAKEPKGGGAGRSTVSTIFAALSR